MKPGKPLQRKTPLRAKSPIKRSAPIKAKRKPPKPKDEAAHMARLGAMGCLICGERPVQLHHATSAGFGRLARTDRRVTPLCPFHHLADHGPHDSIHGLGPVKFNEKHGIDLLAEAERLWDESQA